MIKIYLNVYNQNDKKEDEPRPLETDEEDEYTYT